MSGGGNNQNTPEQDHLTNERAVKSASSGNRIERSNTRERIRKAERRLTTMQAQINDIESRIKTFYKITKDKTGKTIIIVKK